VTLSQQSPRHWSAPRFAEKGYHSMKLDTPLPASPEDVLHYNRILPKAPTFKLIDFQQPVCRFALPLISAQGDQWHIMGTLVMVAPGFALTAQHVIHECFKVYENIDIISMSGVINSDITFTIQAVQFLTGTNAVRWCVRRIYCCQFTDVAFLEMQPLFDPVKIHEMNHIKLNLIPPKKGSRISAFGYPGGKITLDENRVDIELKPHTAIGEVVEVHLNGRDKFLLPYPTFQTNARFDSGMSGGPVFDETGRLCGLICKSIHPFTDNEDHVSYVALLWPSMATLLSLPRHHDPKAVPYMAIELAKDNYIDALGWEQVVIINDNEVGWQDRSGTVE
jgi:hypothetical protein